MTTPWFDPALYGWIPGTLLGVTGGLLGGLVGMQASRGKLRRGTARLVLATGIVSAGLLLAGIAALVLNQPRGVWYSLLHPGAIGLGVFGVLAGVVWRVRGKSPAGA